MKVSRRDLLASAADAVVLGATGTSLSGHAPTDPSKVRGKPPKAIGQRALNEKVQRIVRGGTSSGTPHQDLMGIITPSDLDVLVGREPRRGFPFSQNPALPHTIGNYWPDATTVFDYVRRAMPPDAPGSLTDAEVYGLTAFLLHANELLPSDAVLDATTLPMVAMPARDHFVPDTRPQGQPRR